MPHFNLIILGLFWPHYVKMSAKNIFPIKLYVLNLIFPGTPPTAQKRRLQAFFDRPKMPHFNLFIYGLF